MILKTRNREIALKRKVGEIIGEKEGAVIIFIGGMHGNEPSGLIALENIIPVLKEANVFVKGEIHAFTGNMRALSENKRFIEKDLNRLWTVDRLKAIDCGEINLENCDSDTKEQIELYQEINELLKTCKGPFIFIDLHTTSAVSTPFITINDVMKNRKYSKKFPVPVVLGIEEYLGGPLLSYMNELDHVSLGFEAGDHDSQESIENQESFIYLALVYSGIIESSSLHSYAKHFNRLKKHSNLHKSIFEVRHHKSVTIDEDFSMNPGYSNFQEIADEEILAKNNDGDIHSPEEGYIFMPLYQKQGDDGFFIIKKIPKWSLGMSAVLRRINFDSILTILPGVSRHPNNEHTLVVNKRIARYLAIELFHLLGYRRKEKLRDVMLFSRREHSNDE